MRINRMSIAFLLAMGMSASAFAAGSDEHDHGGDDQTQTTQSTTDGHSDGHQGHGASEGGMMHDMEDMHQMHEMMMPDRTVEVVARDIEFSISEISVAPGETVRFVIRNEGQMPHDFTIGDRAIQEAHRSEMMGDMMDEGMGQMTDHMHNNQNAVIILPGETRELVWTFAQGEELQFGCNVPGHFEAGMHGRFVTEG